MDQSKNPQVQNPNRPQQNPARPNQPSQNPPKPPSRPPDKVRGGEEGGDEDISNRGLEEEQEEQSELPNRGEEKTEY